MKIKLDGKTIEVVGKKTILEIAKEHGVDIPFLCNHPDICVTGSCRICVVRINNENRCRSACDTVAVEGMDIITSDPEIEKIRKTNLELLFSQHREECEDCVWNPGCKLLELAEKYEVKINKYVDRKDHYPEIGFGGIVEFDSSKCIDCRNCIEICKKQNVSFLEMEGKGHLFEVVPAKDRACVYCGQCIIHCPAGSFESVGEFEGVEDAFKGSGDENIVFQIAPAARVSISEEFGLDPGTVSTGKLISGLKKVGADKVFDVSFGADFTTIEEAKEFLEKFKDDDLPLFTSCCPSWVRFVEFYYPRFVDNLTTVRSPHIISGAIIKSLASDPEKTTVVSVMPCVSKKYEIRREELKVNGLNPVDYVLTVREVGRLFRNKDIDFEKLPDSSFDDPFGSASGDAVSYGVAGGVMEAALRQAFFMKTGKKIKEKNLKERSDFSFELEGKEIKTKKISGLSQAVKVLEGLKKYPKLFDYLEFMSCPGGCIGGGGQPMPTNEDIRKKRRKGLISTGTDKKWKSAFENDSVSEIYKQLKSKKDIFHTSFRAERNPENINKKWPIKNRLKSKTDGLKI